MSETEQSLSTDDERSVEARIRYYVLPPMCKEELDKECKYTTDLVLFCDKWQQLGERARNLLPDRYVVTGFGPTIELVSYYTNGLGVSVIRDRIELWPSVLFALEEKQAGRK